MSGLVLSTKLDELESEDDDDEPKPFISAVRFQEYDDVASIFGIEGHLGARQEEFNIVLGEEEEHISKKFAARQPETQVTEKFSLAFSGGGIRAAVFQAGVLWRLAEMGLIKNIDYLTAVSGGGYIASSFITHIVEAGRPDEGQSVDDFYRKVVAKTLVRMQENVGDFVRDGIANPGVSNHAGSWLPRALDLPMLLCVLSVTFVINPILFFSTIGVPGTILLNYHFGPGMRAAFCAQSTELWSVFFKETPIDHLAYFCVATFVLMLISMVALQLPCCKLPKAKEKTEGEGRSIERRYQCYLFFANLRALTRRLTIFSFLVGVVLVCVLLLEYRSKVRFDRTLQAAYCQPLMEYYDHPELKTCSITSDTMFDQKGLSWMTNETLFNETRLDKKYAQAVKEADKEFTASEGWPLVLNLTLILILVLSPFFPGLFTTLIVFIGPIILLSCCAYFLQFHMFGTLSDTRLFGKYDFNRQTWNKFGTACLCANLVFMAFYEDIHAIWHEYYVRCLRCNFFAGGKDITWGTVYDSEYCPLLLLTGTANDYAWPGDNEKSITNISFTCLHTGSQRTGYVTTGREPSLAKYTALTGAGCIDGIIMKTTRAASLRFWLEFTNLSWGAYIMFVENPDGECKMMRVRLPAIIWAIVMNASLLYWWLNTWNDELSLCSDDRTFLNIIEVLAFITVCLSFYSYVLSWFHGAMFLRLFQQATEYYYKGIKPPKMVYITDGGLEECTTIMQLLTRRKKRILLVLANADPNDELGVLKTAMGFASEAKLCSFYDIADPYRDIEIMFEEFAQNTACNTIVIGVRYGWLPDDKDVEYGKIVVVKNKLIDSQKGHEIEPPLTEEEIEGASGRDYDSDLEGVNPMNLTTDELGPLCCCNYCHTKCNLGPKFPHGNFTGYLYLTPAWCSSLMRLAHDTSTDAILKALQ